MSILDSCIFCIAEEYIQSAAASADKKVRSLLTCSPEHVYPHKYRQQGPIRPMAVSAAPTQLPRVEPLVDVLILIVDLHCVCSLGGVL